MDHPEVTQLLEATGGKNSKEDVWESGLAAGQRPMTVTYKEVWRTIACGLMVIKELQAPFLEFPQGPITPFS